MAGSDADRVAAMAVAGEAELEPVKNSPPAHGVQRFSDERSPCAR
jgi:hypothetical protein